MKQADHNQSFTAADIQRYHAGDMSMQERHALEKAALDDPFLADALEGYQHTSTPQIDLAYLEQQLSEKTTPKRKRVIPLFFSQPWMRAAALFLLIAGAGWTVYRFAFTGKEDLAIAPTITDKKQQDTPVESSTIPPVTTVDSTTLVYTPPTPAPALKNVPQTSTPLLAKPAKKPTPATPILADEASSQPAPAAVASAPAENKLSLRDSEVAARKEAIVPGLAVTQARPVHTFKGQILDAQGNPVPHASITVNGNRSSTVTDIKGQFSLTTPDSVVNATVAAVGYEMNKVSLQNPGEEKTLILNESSSALNEVVVTGYGKKRSRNTRTSAGHTKAEVEELEPENGWSSFNNYISQNIQIPEEVTSKQIKGEVELSFEVNKSGDPVNIKIEKSLCASCDKEAIRLLQEGPGWKKKKKKSGKVKIRF